MVENDQDIRDRSNLSGAFGASASGVSSHAFNSILESVLSLELLPSENNDESLHHAVLSAINEALRSEYEAYTESIGQKAETTLLAGTRRPEFWDAIIRQGADFIDGITVPNNNSDAAKQAATKENGSNNFNRTLMIARAVQQTAEQRQLDEMNARIQENMDKMWEEFTEQLYELNDTRINDAALETIEQHQITTEADIDLTSLIQENIDDILTDRHNGDLESLVSRKLGFFLRSSFYEEGDALNYDAFISAFDDNSPLGQNVVVGDSIEARQYLINALEDYNNSNGTNYLIDIDSISDSGITIPQGQQAILDLTNEIEQSGDVLLDESVIEMYVERLVDAGLTEERAQNLIASLTHEENGLEYLSHRPQTDIDRLSVSPSIPVAIDPYTPS